MANRGRPPKQKYNIDDMIKIIKEYADNTEVPILKEICYKSDWNYDYIMQLQRDNENLSQSIKRLLDKKEVDLERGGLKGKIDKTIVIFSLKQLGWRDKIEVENTNHADINNNLLTIANLINNPKANRALPEDEVIDE